MMWRLPACPPLDQRGFARTDGDNDTVVTCDIGAYEYAPLVGPLDHFLCYKAAAERELSVTLSDFLDTGTYAGKTLKLFCNPANKNGEGVSDTATHLTSYKIKGPHAAQTAIELSTSSACSSTTRKKADIMMVPAAKSLTPRIRRRQVHRRARSSTTTGA